MAKSVLYPHITDLLAAEHPGWVIWSDQHGWLPRVAGGATEDDTGDGDGDGSGNDDHGQDAGDDQDQGDAGKSGDKVELTQADLDALVQKRLGQAQKKWEKDQADAAEKAKMTEAEKLKVEKAEAEKAAEDRTAAANQRVIRSEAKVAAVDAGVKPDRAKAFLRVVDLDGIEVDDDGEPDAKAIAKAVKATLEEFPEFRGSAAGKGGASGSEHGDGPKNKPTSLVGAVANHYAGD